MRTPEQVLREIVAEHVFRIALLTSENDKLSEEVKKLSEDSQKLVDETVKRMSNGYKE